jgi:anti-sigma regulatory factor (Ser/Thr protein kinase)
VFTSNDSAPSDDVFDALIAAAGEAADVLARAATNGSDDPVLVLAVPNDLGDDPRQRVADATGVAVDELDLPGYPLGDVQPELWNQPPQPPRMARLRLRPDPADVRTIRDLLDRLLASWRLDGRVEDGDLKLAASELAANAILHAQSPERATVSYLGNVIRVEVEDRSGAMPERREQRPDAISGRGLHLVDTLSERWGVTPRPVGKSVWCELPVTAERR